jgi:hypothetical protein
MPIKFDREMSTHLFKFISTVNFSFNRMLPCELDFDLEHLDFLEFFLILSLSAFLELLIIQALDSRTNSIRELMRQVQTPRYSKANPRLKIDVNIHNTYLAPVAKFNFIDGSDVCTC